MKSYLLKKVPLFSTLEEEELEKVLRLTNLRKYSKGNLILMESEEGSSLFIISRGSVKISRISDDGKEVILAILRNGDFFGEMSLLDGLSRSANVTAIEDSELLILRREDFLNLIKEYPEITISLLKELAKRLRKSDSQIESLSLMNATGKVASAILQLIDYSDDNLKGPAEIKNLPSQQNLASMAGTSRETISRVLQNFIKEGLIKKEGKKLIINDLKKFREKFK